MTYTVNYGKTDGYCCPYRYKAKDCGCMKGKIKAETLEDIVSEEIERNPRARSALMRVAVKRDPEK